MADDPRLLQIHLDWLGFLQPVGLVVSATALTEAGIRLERNALEAQEACREWVTEQLVAGEEVEQPVLADLPGFLRGFLGWPDQALLGLSADRPVPERLWAPLPDLGDVLRPTLALCDPPRGLTGNLAGDAGPDAEALLLVEEVAGGLDLDRRRGDDATGLGLSPQQRFERLLRETGVAVGLLSNGTHLRLVYAPGFESAGHLTWPVAALVAVDGRPLVAALHQLLNHVRLLGGRAETRLPALLQRSREIQNNVSVALAGQVLQALYLLLQGFQEVDRDKGGALLGPVLADDPAKVYAGLLSVLMRLIFLLYAEDRGLLPETGLYREHYGVHALATQLDRDHDRYRDTMGQRTGAWARLLALFDALHGGCRYPEMELPRRLGHLFDPASYPFLAGEALPDHQLPRISDGCVQQVLRQLLVLKGERLSYRTLDVEEIGSVYQAIMGFTLEPTAGPSLALGSNDPSGKPPVVINLDDLLATPPAQRVKWLKEQTGLSWTGRTWAALRNLATVADAEALLQPRIARWATPRVVPAGEYVLQPTAERRNTGSHYTPRKLTEPVVRKTLAPILAQLGEHPAPSEILSLKVLDPACGSGAFLVEACRQLGAALVKAWEVHGGQPVIPADETPELYAMRLVAQQCLYGVDINPTAVNLCKLSLWLATLSQDQPFTFLDHAIRTGDALVGLSQQQIAGFTWGSGPTTLAFGQQDLADRITESVSHRLSIIGAPDTMSPAEKLAKLKLADDRLDPVRQIGDLCLAAFFNASTNPARHRLRKHYLDAQLKVAEGDTTALHETHEARQTLRDGEHPVTPFHWEIEFPEVFAEGTRHGFDAVIGNPPYAGIETVRDARGKTYAEYLRESTPETGGKCDLIAYFFRRAFDLLREDGCLGLVATNTIAEGNTRESGLRWICTNGGTIYDAMKRYPWTTGAAVVVSTVCIMKGDGPSQRIINGRTVPMITAYLFHSGGHDKPHKLRSNHSKCFEGNKSHCMGFTFDDNPRGDDANTMAAMHDIIIRDDANAQLVHPFIGGQELNNSPVATHDRYIIDMNHLDEPEAREWPDLYGILERQVKPSRMRKADNIDAGDQIARRWWKHGHTAAELADARLVSHYSYAASLVTTHWGITRVADETICSHKLCVYPSSNHVIFPILQSRCHEIWAWFFSSTRGDGLNYTPTDCFETFPFPPEWEGNDALRAAGEAYYAFREGFLRDQWVGLTQTYNLFHHPEPALMLDRLWGRREGLPDWRATEGVAESMARHLRPSALEETRRWQCARDGVPYDWTSQELRSIEAAGSRTLYPTVRDAVQAIERLRALHAAMDRAVADAYGWADLDLQCVFTPEHSSTPEEIAFATAAEALEWQATQDEPMKWRYRWGEALHDEVLMRLMRLNEERAREEAGRGW